MAARLPPVLTRKIQARQDFAGEAPWFMNRSCNRARFIANCTVLVPALPASPMILSAISTATPRETPATAAAGSG